ncbi:hypothetical protein JCM5296_005982 [Sporobolomyces johnsonii]
MKKIFGGSRRSKTPGPPGSSASQTHLDFGGPTLPLGSFPTSTVPPISPPPTTISPSGSGLVKPKATYGTPVPSPSITPYNPIPQQPHPYPTPPASHQTHYDLRSLAQSPSSAAGGMTRIMSPQAGMPASPTPMMFGPGGGGNGAQFPGTTMMQGNNSVAETDPQAQAAAVEFESKLSVGQVEAGPEFDVANATTFSGVAYGSNRHMQGAVRQILSWPGSYETFRKVPTCIAYYQPSPNDEAQIVAWGIQASVLTLREGFYKIEWFKLFLDPLVLRDGRLAASARLPDLPFGKQPIDVVTDYLSCLWKYAKERITEEIGSVADLEAADVILTVPAAWDAAGCSLMREAAIKAGMVQSARGGDRNWRDRLRIITEPEAAAIHASTLSTLHRLRASQSFIICDAGGGTVDTAAYKLIGQLSQLEIAEMCARSGANCGSLFLDLRFEALVKSLLRDHPVHRERDSLMAFRNAFSDCDKLQYLGEEDDDTHFRFNCFNIEDGYDPECGLENGELVIPGSVLRRDVFDPVVEQVLATIELQLSKVPSKTVNAIILVGGFAASEYLFGRVQKAFGDRIATIARPRDADVATLQGAARYGLGLIAGKAAVSSVVCPKSYIMKSKLPAEDEDRYKRPGFITTNNAGIEVCENRLSYLVAKGAVLRKGQRLKSRFCKFSRHASDCMFTAVLYCSDEDQIYRYTDEGEIQELARWTVDLSPLPSFQFNAQTSSGGFYTEFDLGLILDSAEVLGVLVTDEGEEVGRATFEFLN